MLLAYNSTKVRPSWTTSNIIRSCICMETPSREKRPRKLTRLNKKPSIILNILLSILLSTP